ncbi:MAG: hypothetical protein ACI4I0_00605 [Acutalibacteraceae bacterium]
MDVATFINQLVEIITKIYQGSLHAVEIYAAFLKAVEFVLSFLEETGISKWFVDVVFNIVLKILGAA